jgi:hypothetical protein
MTMYDRIEGQAIRLMPVTVMLLIPVTGCDAKGVPMDNDGLQEFGTQYTAAWCSQNPASVAAFFAEGGSLQINEEKPSVGQSAITAAAESFMTALPDMVVAMNAISTRDDHVVYRWTLTGTNTGPGGTGNTVHISGYEEWTIGEKGLIAESKGHFDEVEYERQLNAGGGGT